MLALALVLATFVYLRLRRREFVILRALGKPKGAGVRQMLIPVTLVGGAGILTGGFLSWSYALEKAAQTLATLQGPQGAEGSTELSGLWLYGLCVSIFLMFLLFSLIGALLVARQPVLALLQGSAASGKRARKGALARENAEAQVDMRNIDLSVISFVPLPTYGRGGKRVSADYVLRHIRRAPLKSGLTAALALCFTASLGWMDIAIERSKAEIEQLYANTIIEMEIVRSDPSSTTSEGGFILQRTVDSVLDSGFVQSAYLDAQMGFLMIAAQAEELHKDGIPYDEVRAEKGELRIMATNDADAFLSRYAGMERIEYAPGYDQDAFFGAVKVKLNELPLLVSDSILKTLEAEVGDTIYFVDASGWSTPCKVCGRILTNLSIPIVTTMHVLEYLRRESPASSGKELYYYTAEFVLDPAKNRELPAFKESIQAFVKKSSAGLLPMYAVFWDEDLTNAVAPMEKNVQLLSILYPVTIALSAIIAAGLSVLLLLQSAKEAAVLRVLGNTRRRVWAMLCSEQLFLTLLGLVLGLFVLILVRSGQPDLLTTNALLCALIYLGGALIGSVFTAASVVRKTPIALLQVKE